LTSAVSQGMTFARVVDFDHIISLSDIDGSSLTFSLTFINQDSTSAKIIFFGGGDLHTHTHTQPFCSSGLSWIFWCKMKITQADTPQSGRTATASRLIGAPISAIPTIFTPDALPCTTLPIYLGLGQAPNVLACIPGGLVWWWVI